MTAETSPPAEGWYLMSTAELEAELGRRRGEDRGPSSAIPLTVREALDFRNAGNVPDTAGRSLRLVLHVLDRPDVLELAAKRLVFEPDYHDAPTWRRSGSVPVNVVPLRLGMPAPMPEVPWWKDPELEVLESEWKRHGTVAGIAVPGAYRGFVYKTVLALRSSGREVTVQSIIASIARWLPERDTEEIRAAIVAANSQSL